MMFTVGYYTVPVVLVCPVFAAFQVLAQEPVLWLFALPHVVIVTVPHDILP